jgi:hypothetical protein
MAVTLDDLRSNPKGNWTIQDVGRVCRQAGVSCTPPSSGSHYKVSHSAIARILTIPYKRPIKPVYIKQLVKFIDEVSGHHGTP